MAQTTIYVVSGLVGPQGPQGPPGAGETNTASNQGAAGVSIFKQKVGVDFEFKSINSGNAAISIVDDGANNEVDITLVEANIAHGLLSGAGTNSHSTIDNHLANVNNPHSVTKTQVGLPNVLDTKVNATAVIAPTVNDDFAAGYSILSRWVDTVLDKEYVCVDSTTGAAIWFETTAIPELGETWINPTLLNNWANFGLGYAVAGYYKKGDRIYLKGLVKDGTRNSGATGNIFVLPIGYRPLEILRFPISLNSGVGKLEILTTGDVRAISGGNNSWSFDNIDFRIT